MTNIHRCASGQADPSFPQAVKHWLVEVASFPSEQPFPTFVVGVQKIFLSNDNFLGKCKHLMTSCFTCLLLADCQRQRGPCTHHGLPDHRDINIAQAYFPALHNTAYAELQNRIRKLKHTQQALSVAKKNTFLPNPSYESLGFLQQGSHQRINIRAALQNDCKKKDNSREEKL